MPRKTFRNKITSDELTEKINPKNVALWKRFIKEKNTRCSDTTITGYESDLNIFFTWNLLYNENKLFMDIKKIEFSDFFVYAVEELKWGSARFGRLRSTLSTLSDFVEKYYDEDYPKFRNVILKAIESMPKVPAREKSVFTEEEIDGLMNYLENELENPQEACLLALAIGSGARISELLRFDVDLINENNVAFGGLFLETTKRIKTKGRTKVGSQLFKYIIKDIFLEKYKTWLIEREKIMLENNQEHNHLFIKRDGTPAKLSTIQSWMTKWDNYLDKPFYAHSLRHYIVSHLTRLNCSSDFIVEIMGWKSGGAMYQIYNDVEGKDREWKEIDKLKNHFENKSNSDQSETQ